MNKKIIFFDGDGTLWYPKSTKRTKAPHWVYEKNKLLKDYLPHLVLVPGIIKTLKFLKEKGIIIVALSTHPHKRVEADMHMTSKIVGLKLGHLFDEVCTARPYPWGKGKKIESILKKYKIKKPHALLVGDSYIYDYLSAKKVGVECVLIKTKYSETPASKKQIHKTIFETREVERFFV